MQPSVKLKNKLYNSNILLKHKANLDSSSYISYHFINPIPEEAC